MDLFLSQQPSIQEIAKDAYLLQGFALSNQAQILADLSQIISVAPFRQMVTPGGFTMSVAMTNCGTLGWITDRKGYRYISHDPLANKPWPAMPACCRELALRAATQAGFGPFQPDACLINVYEPGAKLSLHQDKDELDLRAPIVSLSLGLPAVFLFGTPNRNDRPQRLRLVHGDVVVWGGPSRLAYHGVSALADGEHALLGRRRVNLTFRRVG